MTSNEQLHIKAAQADTSCDIHEWATEGIALRLVAEMRKMHGRGGVNACRDCLERCYEDRDRQRAGNTEKDEE